MAEPTVEINVHDLHAGDASPITIRLEPGESREFARGTLAVEVTALE